MPDMSIRKDMSIRNGLRVVANHGKRPSHLAAHTFNLFDPICFLTHLSAVLSKNRRMALVKALAACT